MQALYDDFPDGKLLIPPDQRRVYAGRMEVIPLPLLPGNAKRAIDFVLDLRDAEYLSIQLTENGKDCVEMMAQTKDMFEIRDSFQTLPVMFYANVPWLVVKLLPKFRPGNPLKGIRRTLIPRGVLPEEFFKKAI